MNIKTKFVTKLVRGQEQKILPKGTTVYISDISPELGRVLIKREGGYTLGYWQTLTGNPLTPRIYADKYVEMRELFTEAKSRWMKSMGYSTTLIVDLKRQIPGETPIVPGSTWYQVNKLCYLWQQHVKSADRDYWYHIMWAND